jgi:ABC-2 type transport system permease protein
VTDSSGSFDHPIVHLVRERFREFWREPGVVFWTFGFPILLVIVLSLAFRESGPEKKLIAIVAGDGAEALKTRIDSSASLSAFVANEVDARVALKEGRAALVVVPGVTLRIVLDESRAETALVEAALRDALREPSPANVGRETVATRGDRYVDFLVPGMIGMTLLNGGAWGVGWGLILMRTRKLLKRLCATPMSRSHLLAAYLLFRVVMSVVETAILLAIGVVIFDTPFSGGVFATLVLVVLSAFSFGGLGLLCASRAENPQSGNGYVNLATLPMFLVSGVFFSAKNFPNWLQPAIDALPLTAFNDGLRAILNDGAGLASLMPQFGVLAAWGVLCFALALRLFRWT